MASSQNNLSSFEFEVPSGEGLVIGIVAATWNSQVTDALLEGAKSLLEEQGVEEIIIKRVPGAYELTMGANLMCEYQSVDAVIVLGAIIRGETPHFDFIAQGVTAGINSVGLKHNIPIIFGVLTTDTLEQATDRAGGKHGNKGAEAAATALAMVELHNDFIEEAYEEEMASMDFEDEEE